MGFARTDLAPSSAAQISLSLAAAAALQTGKGPGLDQQYATQLAVFLACRREVYLRGGSWFHAEYDKDGKFLGRFTACDKPRKDARVIDICGDGPMMLTGVLKTASEKSGMGEDWGLRLARACDGALLALTNSETGQKPPVAAELTPALGPAFLIVPIIVSGLAATVVATVAAWRFLDPQARQQIHALDTAHAAYIARTKTMIATGTMPPATPIEKSAANHVDELADAAGSEGWKNAALIGGGTIAGAVAAAALS